MKGGGQRKLNELGTKILKSAGHPYRDHTTISCCIETANKASFSDVGGVAQIRSREIRILLSNGKVVQFTLHELRGLIYGRRVIALMAFFLLAIAVSNPTLFPAYPVVTTRAFYWGLSMVLYLIFLPYWAGFYVAFLERISGRPVPLLIATAPFVVLLTALSASLPVLFGDFLPVRSEEVVVMTFLVNCIIAHLIETVGLAWLLPLYRSEHGSEPAAISDPAANFPDPEFVVLAGRSMPIETILRVQSAEHYLIVTTNQRTLEIRARMKDFLEQVADDDGIQTHRSFWVSYAEAHELSGMTVHTSTGGSVPVSRGRLPVVRDWFHGHGKPH